MSYSGDVVTLLAGVTVDTNGAAVSIKGGRYRFFAYSSAFGGGTAKLQWTPDGINWFDFGDGMTFTVSGSKENFLPGGQYRGVLTGSTAASALTILLAQVTS